MDQETSAAKQAWPGIPYIDIALIYAEEDRADALRYYDHIKRVVGPDVIVSLHDGDVFGPLSGASTYEELEVICERSTFLFLYLTKTFIEDALSKSKSESMLIRSIEEKKWCVIPVYTQKKDDLKIPMPLNAIRGVKFYHNDAIYQTTLKSLVRDKLDSRIQKQEEMLNKLIDSEKEDCKDWPNEKDLTAPVRVVKCNQNLYRFIHLRNQPDVYHIGKNPRGHCVIISNTVFDGGNERGQGALRDENGLEEMFRQLHFKVILHRNKTAKEMKEIMRQESSHTDHDAADCFVCIVTSHGNETGVCGTDGSTVPIADITTSMNGEHCTALRGKPKLFFIDACRGDTVDIPSEPDERTNDLSAMIARLLENMSKKLKEQTRPSGRPTIPTQADILVALATHHGYISLEDTKYGSWFLQSIIYIFQRFANKMDIGGMLNMVNKLVSEKFGNLEEDVSGVKQASVVTTGLTKRFFFFPGVSD